MWLNPKETADSSHLLKNSLMENFTFCAVLINIFWFFVEIAVRII